jgi:hypothetical protein
VGKKRYILKAHHFRGQAWSIDLIIAVVIFVLVITIFYTLLVREPKPDVKALQRDAKLIVDKISDPNNPDDCSFIKGKDIDTVKMKNCFNATTYGEFKETYNLEHKFCIFIVDQNGRVVTINGSMGFGFPELNISGTLCGQQPS